jgi:alpha-glucosidase
MVGRVSHLGYASASKYVDEAVMRQAVAMQMTWIGAPTVYYGDEAGVCGFTDPDNRRTYPWGNENLGLLDFHKTAIRIHKESSALRTGSMEILFGENNVVSYARFDENEKIIVVVNRGDKKSELKIPVWIAEVPMQSEMEQMLYSWDEGFTSDHVMLSVDEGNLSIEMGKNSVAILRYKVKK